MKMMPEDERRSSLARWRKNLPSMVTRTIRTSIRNPTQIDLEQRC
jgi:hypothetical protein